jgi:hypothetical protein
MATVAKSIIYAWPNVPTSSLVGTFYTASFGRKTLYFPETSSRVFKSVYAEISFHDSFGSGVAALADLQVQLKLSGSNTSSLLTFSYSSFSGGSTGENMSLVSGPYNFTSFFNTNIPSNSSSINLEAFSYTGNSNTTDMNNASFKLYCTYEHDDIDTTYIKTAIIPLESPTSGLSQTIPGVIGNQQIPRLISSRSVNLGYVDDISFDATQTSFVGNYLVTDSGSYRLVLATGWGDNAPDSLYARIYNSSSNELLIDETSTGPAITVDQYVFISSSSLPTKFRYEVYGNVDYSGGNTQVYLSQSVFHPAFLPESNVNIRDYFVEIEGNETGGSSTDIQLTGSITSSFSNTRTTFFPVERSQTSDTYDRLIWSVPTSSLPNISQSHNFGLRTNISSDAAFRHVPVNLYVTYEYNKTTTTQVNNTVLLGCNLNSPLNYGGAFSASANVFVNTFTIPENNPVLQQSALRIQWADTSTISNALVRVGPNQNNSTDYTDGGGAICGMKSLQHRFDISASNQFANTSNIVLKKGINTINSSFFTFATQVMPSNTSGYYIINYKSDVHPTKGVDGCTRYYYFINKQWANAYSDTTPIYYSSSFSYNLSNSSSLYLVDSSYNYMSFERNATTLLNLGIHYTGSEAFSKASVYPKENVWQSSILSDAEIGSFITTIPTTRLFKRYINSPQTNLMNPFTSRLYSNIFVAPTTTQIYGGIFGITNVLVAHSYTFDFTGSIYNYNGDGSGIPVTIYQSGSTESILQLTSSVGGKFSGTWFDDLTPIFASIDFQDKFGKSKQAIVTGSFDVYLTPFEYGSSNI